MAQSAGVPPHENARSAPGTSQGSAETASWIEMQCDVLRKRESERAGAREVSRRTARTGRFGRLGRRVLTGTRTRTSPSLERRRRRRTFPWRRGSRQASRDRGRRCRRRSPRGRSRGRRSREPWPGGDAEEDYLSRNGTSRAGGKVSPPSACVRERARDNAGRSKLSSARVRGSVGASREDVRARRTLGSLLPVSRSGTDADRAIRGFSRQNLIRERQSIRSRLQISPGHLPGRNLPGAAGG